MNIKALNCVDVMVLSLTNKEKGKDYGQLIDGMSQNVLHHGAGDEWLLASVRVP